MPRPPVELQDLDFDDLTSPHGPRIEAAPTSPQIEEEAQIGRRRLEQAGFHVVVARERGAAHSGKGHILIVEDDDDTAALAVRTLQNGGYETLRAGGAKETEHYLRTLGIPALILLDIDLPGLDGLEMLSRLRAQPRLAAVPVVLFTGRSTREDVVRGLTLGADGYIAKPVAPKVLLQVVRQVLGDQPPA